MSKISTTPVNTSNEDQVGASPSTGKTLHISKPLGHVNMPSLICGGVAALIAIALDLMNRYDGVLLSVQNIYKSKPFYLENVEPWHRSCDWVMAIVLATIITYVVLDSAGKGKPLLFGVVSIVLIGMFSPLLMLWGVFWFPTTVFVAVIFAWVFAYIYTTLHVMPCELGVKMKLNRKHKNKLTPAKKTDA